MLMTLFKVSCLMSGTVLLLAGLEVEPEPAAQIDETELIFREFVLG